MQREAGLRSTLSLSIPTIAAPQRGDKEKARRDLVAWAVCPTRGGEAVHVAFPEPRRVALTAHPRSGSQTLAKMRSCVDAHTFQRRCEECPVPCPLSHLPF